MMASEVTTKGFVHAPFTSVLSLALPFISSYVDRDRDLSKTFVHLKIGIYMNHNMLSRTNDLTSKRVNKRMNASIVAALESLESRLLFSGAVSAIVKDGALIVRGDSAANVIVLDQAGLTADQVRVTGTGATTVNGQSVPVIVDGVTGGLFVRLAGGDDTVTFSDMNIAGGVSVKDFAGSNTLTANNVQIAADLVVQNGSRLSTTTLTNVTVAGVMDLLAVGGRQDVVVQSVDVQGTTSVVSEESNPITLTIDDSHFHGAVRIVGSKGSDTIQIDSNGSSSGATSEFDGPATVRLRGGQDTLQLGITGEPGNSSVFAGAARFSGGDGFDTLLDFAASTYTGTSATAKFESDALAPDITAPTISSASPANNTTGIALNRKIAVTFSEPMDAATIVSANVHLTAPSNTPVTGTVAYVGTTMTFTPASALTANTIYTMTIGTGAADVAGNALAAPYVLTFATGATADTTAPTVTVTDPTTGAVAVALNKKITAAFSEAMDPLTITGAQVTVTGPGSVTVAGAVSYVGTTMTFTPTSNFAPLSTYTATITNGATDLAGNALASNVVWTFTTGAAPDEIAPTVVSTSPSNGQTNVAVTSPAAAVFSESMDASTLTTATYTLQGPGGSSVAGSASYDVASKTATFTPTSHLAGNTTYTAKILGGTNGAKDLAGNALATDKVWTFTTGAAPDEIAPTVASTTPTANQTNVFINKAANAVFSEAMDASTISGTTYTLVGPGSSPVAGLVSYDVPSQTATFTPTSNLAINTTYTARILGGITGAKDVAGNALVTDKVWIFTTGTQIAQAPINLGAASTFAVMATASITSTGATVINGDVGLKPGTSQGIPPNQVNGTVHVNDQAATDAQAALLNAYNDAISRSTTSITLAGNMGGLTFTPGLYTNSSSVMIQGAGPSNNVTLDAQGDPNAIFIFKMASTLTTGPGAQVILAGGAKASNVFWQVGSSATLDTTTIFKGSILASVTITVNNGSAIEGRLLAGSNSSGSVTVNASTVTVPSL